MWTVCAVLSPACVSMFWYLSKVEVCAHVYEEKFKRGKGIKHIGLFTHRLIKSGQHLKLIILKSSAVKMPAHHNVFQVLSFYICSLNFRSLLQGKN